ncbi:MAG: class I SAM-dependent methyltransferase [Smithellaceae bacterium]|nr:class I SAM-dependent methyltransferase [Smithellaceae bacterium]MDD3847896.1 class I SAM-dependent methyltransferase [Smithellaceae bacterium]
MLRFHLDEKIDVSSRNTAFIDRSVDWMASRFDIGAGKKIADFGCGPGLYAVSLARKHAAVTGIDFSKRSIQYARESAAGGKLPIDFIHQNYLDFETDDRFHLILMIMCDFCALSPAQRRNILSRFQRFLEPSGSVLLDVYSLNAFNEREEKTLYEPNLLNGFWSPGPYYGFLNTFKYDKEKVVLDQYTIIEAERSRTIYNWLQYFSPEDLEREFMECGFAIENYYSDVSGTPFCSQSREFAVIAKKS